jgi:hypothetical protein
VCHRTLPLGGRRRRQPDTNLGAASMLVNRLAGGLVGFVNENWIWGSGSNLVIDLTPQRALRRAGGRALTSRLVVRFSACRGDSLINGSDHARRAILTVFRFSCRTLPVCSSTGSSRPLGVSRSGSVPERRRLPARGAGMSHPGCIAAISARWQTRRSAAAGCCCGCERAGSSAPTRAARPPRSPSRSLG